MRARAILIVAAVICMGTESFAQQQKADVGKREFVNSCAVCHGENAKGGGLYTSHLKVSPPDLTVLAKNNGGVFPIERVYEAIDGRRPIGAHGPRDMPIWGTRYSMAAVEHYADVPYDQEAFVRGRILTLIDYLYRIQEK